MKTETVNLVGGPFDGYSTQVDERANRIIRFKTGNKPPGSVIVGIYRRNPLVKQSFAYTPST